MSASSDTQFGFNFDPGEVPHVVEKIPEKKKIIDPLACPLCGGRSQASVRPLEMGGTRYCPVCQGEDGCFYFNPSAAVSPGQEIVKEAFDEVERVITSTPEIQEMDSVLEQTEAAVEIIQTHAELEENGQIPLINIGEWWEEHWKQMPEFVQKDQLPWKSIYVHFENRKDMEAFAKLVSQQINLTTKFIWYPEATISRYVKNNRRYEDSN